MSGPMPLDRPARRIPSGFLGMLALVVAVEWTIADRHLDFTTVWADDWRRSAEAAARQVKGRDVLCFGDSLVKFAVLPRQVEARAGLRAYNLAVNAGTMPSAYFLLRSALGSGARPKAVVADFLSLMQPERPWKSLRLYSELADPGDCLGLAMTAGAPDFFTASMLAKLLPSCKCRFEIRESIRGALEGRRASPWPRESAIWATWKNQSGAQPMPSNPARPPSHPQLVADLSPARWACDPINAAYLDRFLELAGSRDIPVFWVILPLSPEIHASRAVSGSDEAYDRFARAALDRHPGVTVLDGRRSGYDGSAYIDALHLDRRGAKVLTNDVADLLDDRLKHKAPAPRWVDLPAFGRSDEVARAGGAKYSK